MTKTLTTFKTKVTFTLLTACAFFMATTLMVSAAPLERGMYGEEVRQLQQILNTDPDTTVAVSGPGSKGNETTYFGPATEAAVKKFQQKYLFDVIVAFGYSEPTGVVGPATVSHLLTKAPAGELAQFNVLRQTSSVPPTCKLILTPNTITRGQSATLEWSATAAKRVVFTQGILAESGARQVVTPIATTTYTMTVTGINGQTITCTATVGVTTPTTISNTPFGVTPTPVATTTPTRVAPVVPTLPPVSTTSPVIAPIRPVTSPVLVPTTTLPVVGTRPTTTASTTRPVVPTTQPITEMPPKIATSTITKTATSAPGIPTSTPVVQIPMNMLGERFSSLKPGQKVFTILARSERTALASVYVKNKNWLKNCDPSTFQTGPGKMNWSSQPYKQGLGEPKSAFTQILSSTGTIASYLGPVGSSCEEVIGVNRLFTLPSSAAAGDYTLRYMYAENLKYQIATTSFPVKVMKDSITQSEGTIKDVAVSLAALKNKSLALALALDASGNVNFWSRNAKVVVDWGDGIVEERSPVQLLQMFGPEPLYVDHEYINAGKYTVKITVKMFDSTGVNDRLKDFTLTKSIGVKVPSTLSSGNPNAGASGSGGSGSYPGTGTGGSTGAGGGWKPGTPPGGLDVSTF